jgi:hypothetical protein
MAGHGLVVAGDDLERDAVLASDASAAGVVAFGGSAKATKPAKTKSFSSAAETPAVLPCAAWRRRATAGPVRCAPRTAATMRAARVVERAGLPVAGSTPLLRRRMSSGHP